MFKIFNIKKIKFKETYRMALLRFCRIYIKKSKIKTQTKKDIVNVNCDMSDNSVMS